MQTPDNLKAMENIATDLNEVQKQKAIDKVAAERASMEAALKQVQEWDKAMQRAFKGIVSRPARHRMISQGLDEGR